MPALSFSLYPTIYDDFIIHTYDAVSGVSKAGWFS